MSCHHATAVLDREHAARARKAARALERAARRERQLFGWRAWLWVVGVLGLLSILAAAADRMVRAHVAAVMPPRTWSVLELDETRTTVHVWQATEVPVEDGAYVRFATFDGQHLFMPAGRVAIVPPEWRLRR